MERAYHQNTRVMLRDTGSTKKTEAYGSISCEEAAGRVSRYFQAGLRLFDPLPAAYQLRCLQRVQNACAGFVLRKYTNESDLVTLNWLDIDKRRKLSVLKLTFKSLNDTSFPEYLRLSTHIVSAYNLGSSVAPLLCILRTPLQLFSTVYHPMSETLRTMDPFANQ